MTNHSSAEKDNLIMNEEENTRDHNIEVLHSLGFSRIQNTTVFKKGNDYILSPAVAENTNGKYWFDVREVNLNRVNTESLLLVRIVPNLFILEKLKSISSLLSKNVMDNRPNSGNVWGININMQEALNTAFLFNIRNRNNRVKTKLFNKEDVMNYFNDATNTDV